MTPGERSHEPRAKKLWKHGAAPVIGLTGCVAGGKSAVAQVLAERGSAVIDADRVGHDILDIPAVQERLALRFGPGVVRVETGPAGGERPRIDRRALGAIVFADPEARRALEAIVHPLMRERFLETVAKELGAPEESVRAVVLDAAILLEAGWDLLCDRVVFVDAHRSERLRRAEASRGWSDEDFAARERAQWPCERKRQRADFVIENLGTLESLGLQVDALIRTLNEPAPPDSAVTALVQMVAQPRARLRSNMDGTGSDAWKTSYFVL
jgi:dephospho-CoA kinase